MAPIYRISVRFLFLIYMYVTGFKIEVIFYFLVHSFSWVMIFESEHNNTRTYFILLLLIVALDVFEFSLI